MSFQEAGDFGENKKVDKYKGLPIHWEYLESECCPKCGESLVFFPHIDMWKCECGFKISSVKKNEIVYKIKDRNEGKDVAVLGYGYSYGNYDDETPF